MRTVNLREAKTHLLRLIGRTAQGEALATDGTIQAGRLGFMAKQIAVPDDFDRWGEGEIEDLFGDAPRSGR